MINKLTYTEILEQRPSIDKYKESTKYPISVLLNNIRSLYNVGSIFRTCDSAAINELILTGYTPAPPRQEIYKTALGATETVNWKYDKNILNAIFTEKEKGNKIIAVELTDKSRIYNSLTINDFPMCLIFGNELTGIDNEVLKECDDAIIIPMYGVKHSLNVGVAAGITIYEAVKCYKDIIK